MAENPLAPRGMSRIWGHLWMILGVILVVFPVYYVFIASTHSTQTILRPPLPLLPGPEGLSNYGDALSGGIGLGYDRQPAAQKPSSWASSPRLNQEG